MEKYCYIQRLGLVPYQTVWEYQKELAVEIAAGQRYETLLLLEHPHTFTLGRRGQADHLLWTEAELKKKGIDVLWVDRGGDITYHGPGQLVGYPILRLAPIGWQSDRIPQADYIGYIRRLEEVLIDALEQFHITGERIKGKTGVWVRPARQKTPQKIASIGVKVDVRGVSRHGFALNVNPDMHYWEGIVPCGLSRVEMTSMVAWLSEPVSLVDVQEVIEVSFAKVFNKKMVRQEPAILQT